MGGWGHAAQDADDVFLNDLLVQGSKLTGGGMTLKKIKRSKLVAGDDGQTGD